MLTLNICQRAAGVSARGPDTKRGTLSGPTKRTPTEATSLSCACCADSGQRFAVSLGAARADAPPPSSLSLASWCPGKRTRKRERTAPRGDTQRRAHLGLFVFVLRLTVCVLAIVVVVVVMVMMIVVIVIVVIVVVVVVVVVLAVLVVARVAVRRLVVADLKKLGVAAGGARAP